MHFLEWNKNSGVWESIDTEEERLVWGGAVVGWLGLMELGILINSFCSHLLISKEYNNVVRILFLFTFRMPFLLPWILSMMDLDSCWLLEIWLGYLFFTVFSLVIFWRQDMIYLGIVLHPLLFSTVSVNLTRFLYFVFLITLKSVHVDRLCMCMWEIGFIGEKKGLYFISANIYTGFNFHSQKSNFRNNGFQWMGDVLS